MRTNSPRPLPPRTYRSSLRRLLLGRGVRIELVGMMTGIDRLLHHLSLRIFGGHSAVRVTSSLKSTLLFELRRLGLHGEGLEVWAPAA